MSLSPHCSLWINWGDDRVKCSRDWWLLMKSNILSPRHHLAELGIREKRLSTWADDRKYTLRLLFPALAQRFSLWLWLEFGWQEQLWGKHVLVTLENFHTWKPWWGGGGQSSNIFQRYAHFTTVLLSHQRAHAHLKNSENLTWVCLDAAATPCGTRGAFHASAWLSLTVKGVKDTYLMRWI